ncbi:chromate transporter [Humitalea rosea]|uniref:Chromate transporter n=1 Tax=Humitalea rosea TaxID=990373 RepID=A0A2W7ISU1_9PROT|nr:chromate transporter [Humitalea rosea]PZW50319.1 chromate transporter [Humitalea rosea]
MNDAISPGIDTLGPPPGPWGLFTAYAKAASLGFGGANAWCRRVIVEERRWMTEREYAEVMGIGQVLPGPNVGNAAVMIGRRFAGLPGSVAACLGLYGPPLVMLMGFALAWDQLGSIPTVAGFMHGVAAAAAGMVIGNAARQATRLRLPWDLIGIGLCAAAAAAWFQMPLLLIVAVLGPAGIAAVVVRGRRA